jgi:hypothetical protein
MKIAIPFDQGEEATQDAIDLTISQLHTLQERLFKEQLDVYLRRAKIAYDAAAEKFGE